MYAASPKNNFYYYQSWWSNKDVIHLFPHWNWKGSEGKTIDVWCFSNADSVELFLNGKSLGRKNIARDSHAEWKVVYEPGTIEVKGWRNGKIISDKEVTTGEPVSVTLSADKNSINADGQDVAVITATVLDSKR